MTFAQAVMAQTTRTENGMKSLVSSGSRCLDLFSSVSEYRDADITAPFTAALVENPMYALRIALWGRDVRKGAGEREFFRKILRLLEVSRPLLAMGLATRVSELGRWDDLLVFETERCQRFAFGLIAEGLEQKNQLCAKWMPRKGPVADKLRCYLLMSWKQYRTMLVSLTNVVETKMCAKDWDSINFSHVPSVAAARYRKAFYRNAEQAYTQYVSDLQSNKEGVKVNAGAIFPHDVILSLLSQNFLRLGQVETNFIAQQWNSLPNYVGDARVLALVDVSGSMGSVSLSKSGLTALSVALSLGMYVADKNLGPFKDTFLTFSSKPRLQVLKGNIVEKFNQLSRAHWETSTDLNAALEEILRVAKEGKVSQEEMPQVLLILSDMQFNACVKHDDRAIEMIRRKYEAEGYTAPTVVFWNLNQAEVRDLDKSVTQHDRNTAMVSGFSPAILKSVLSGNLDSITAESVMLSTIMDDRYDPSAALTALTQ
jgi:hypothetical protein